MTETVVHVTTLEQWKSVLDVWFKNGYSWYSGDQKYHKSYFKGGIRELLLDNDNDILTLMTPATREPISYKDFMAQQKEDNKMETYYVTQEQFDLIEELKVLPQPLVAIMNKRYGIDKLYNELPLSDKEWLRYLGGDETVEFKVKEQLYRLWRIDDSGDTVYMKFSYGTPDWTMYEDRAFTAPLQEIKKWQTQAWEIEKAD